MNQAKPGIQGIPKIQMDKLIEGLAHDDSHARTLLAILITSFNEQTYSELLRRYGTILMDCIKSYERTEI